MKALKFSAFLLLLVAQAGFTCDVTLSAGNNLISSAVSSASTGDEICLNAGTYTESYSISLKQGQTLRGLGSTMDDTEIYSEASPIINLGSSTTVRNFKVIGVSSPQYGLLAYNDPDAVIWSVKLQYIQNPISVVAGSDDVAIWDTYISNGGIDNSAPDPSIWVDESDNVEILYGAITGRSNGVGGDGEIACRNSTYMNINGMYMSSSGAAGMYFVNCDNATVQNATIVSGDEWGLDVVDGSSNFTATGNTINYNFWGAVIFDEADNGSGTFTNNYFVQNNTSGNVNCQGIVVIGNVNNVSQSSNYAYPSPVICAY